MVLLVLLTGCLTPPPPALPATLHIPADTPELEREAWELAAASWSTEVGHDVVARISDRRDGCGIFVVRGDRLAGTSKAGWAQVTGPCRAEVMLHPELQKQAAWRMLVAAQHELGHIFQNTNHHSLDPMSVMYGSLVDPDDLPACDSDEAPGANILAADVALVRVRLPGGSR